MKGILVTQKKILKGNGSVLCHPVLMAFFSFLLLLFLRVFCFYFLSPLLLVFLFEILICFIQIPDIIYYLEKIGNHTGCLKKMVQCLLCKFLCNQVPDFQIRFFSWKLRSICKFWIQNLFCAILGGQDIYKTKCDSETGHFIFMLSHNGLKTSKLAQSSAKWPKTGPDSSQVAPSGPRNTN